MDIQKIQDYLMEHELDGWLMADFHARNNVAVEMLHLSGIVTRRSFYFIPAVGEPVGFVHAVEQGKFASLPGKITAYSGYQELEQKLGELLSRYKKVAVEYSPMGRLPYIGLVDAGTIELIRSFGVEIVSSADLVANFQARLTPEQIAAHRIAAHNVIEIKDRAFEFIVKALRENRSVNEFEVVRFILGEFNKYDMFAEEQPIVGVEANAGNPHYEPSERKSAAIKKGQLILIDLWAKLKHADGVYADITWMGFAGTKDEIPSKHVERFAVIAAARDAAVEFLRRHIDNRPVFGSEVDDVCRHVIEKAGYGAHFTHRTGHSITSHGHGPGPNIDNLETEDKRKLQKGHLFSIEPGIYFDDCGFRTEINVLISHNGPEITTLPLQTEILPLF